MKKKRLMKVVESVGPAPGDDVVWDAPAPDAETTATEVEEKKSKKKKKVKHARMPSREPFEDTGAGAAQASDEAKSDAARPRQGRKRANINSDSDEDDGQGERARAAADDNDAAGNDTDVPTVLYEKKKPRGKTKKLADGKLPCTEFATSMTCRFGDACKFSHLLEGQPLTGGVSLKTRKKRRATCIAFAEGTCKYGDKCRYVVHMSS